MASIEKDSRFSRVLTDPRFLPMPTYQRKVKIDKRFNALFTSKDFGHRTLLDKRGRPIHDVSKRSKHVMEQFYDISSEGSSASESEESESADHDSEEDVEEVSDNDSQLKATKSKDKSIKKKEPKKEDKKRKRFEEDKDCSEQQSPTKKRKTVVKSKDKSKLSDDVKAEGRLIKDSEKKESRDAKPMKINRIKLQRKESDMMEDESSDDEEEEESCNVKKSKFKANDDKSPKVKKKQTKEFEESEESSDEDDDVEKESSESESDSSSEEEEIDEYTTEHDLAETAVDHKWNELHTDAPAVTESTHRLAVCNMDWDFVKAQDLFVLFKSFAGEGGSIRSVTIYPSEFGKERMAEEVLFGPKEMRDNLKTENTEDSNSKQKKKQKKNRNRTVDGQILKRMERQMVKEEHEVLRNYQLNRLRYYYAVVDCSSVEVADNIYKECDGQEYQLSCVKLDLRFIPDDMEFDETPKESFTEEQGLVDFTPRTFNSTALSQAKVEVTWDETEFDRLHRRMIYAQHKELEDIVEENRHADIIAPPESDSEIDDEDGRPQWLRRVLAENDDDDDDDDENITEEKKIELYRKVLMDKLVEEEDKEKKENEIDKELEFQPGLKSAVEKKLKKTEKAQGSVVDDYLVKKKEKKKKKREQKKAELAEQEGGSDDDDESKEMGDVELPGIIDDSLKEMMESEGIDVDSLNAKKKKKDKKKKHVLKENDDSEAEREKAELELLLMEDGTESKVAKPEKIQEGKLSRRQKKKKALLEKEQKKKAQDDSTIDMNDQRFSAMFTDHHFHIDPNAPEFKKTQNMLKLVDEQIKRKPKKNKDKVAASDVDEVADSRAVSKKLVESLKRKMKK